MNPDSINLGERFRKDLGDIDDLVQSIRDHGLLQPLVIDPDNNLIAGQRRLAACRKLSMRDVPVFVVSGLQEAALRIAAERDENTCRKDMNPSELVAIGTALEELERPKAAERHQEGSSRGGRAEGAVPANSTLDNSARDTSGYTRNIVGSALGMSGITYDRAKRVIEASDDAQAPPEVRDTAKAARAEMDRTGNVSGAYNKVRRAQKEAEPETPAVPEHRPDTPDNRARHPRLHHKDAARILPRFLTGLNGIAAVIEDMDFSDCRLEPYQISELDRAVRVILTARKTLKECST